MVLTLPPPPLASIEWTLHGNTVSGPTYALWFAATPFSRWQAVSDYHISWPDNKPTAADVGSLGSNCLTSHKDGGIVRIRKKGAHYSCKFERSMVKFK